MCSSSGIWQIHIWLPQVSVCVCSRIPQEAFPASVRPGCLRIQNTSRETKRERTSRTADRRLFRLLLQPMFLRISAKVSRTVLPPFVWFLCECF